MELRTESDRLRTWAEKVEDRSDAWERAYPNWIVAHAAVERFLANDPDPDEEEIADLLFLLARDNDAHFVADLLADAQRAGLAVARAGLGYDDFEARWQIASYLGGFVDDESKQILRDFVEDAHEYVRRNALVSLRSRDPSFAERVARDWIKSEHAYSRLAAIIVLHELGSSHLSKALRALREDPFEHVRNKVRELSARVTERPREAEA
ncbi:MAG: HEAT repeat domain-containing protein [Planctomycetes bacterium]|nr:HEAT repeat domain-containing protein [Planctomycetota bacterium]